jgi:hypothetical protein
MDLGLSLSTGLKALSSIEGLGSDDELRIMSYEL